ncbi:MULTISPECIES: cytochrome o ubiquinol oxidase subunit IV [unclassified Rhizobium]|uniref:cytochrome o ubiquinol oxidase subunit IV n=1 Tax=unclassified Rhizobium TaxID=2613769 RepID=UPI001ADB8B27|nr:MULTISPECIES: cytochrome o ubiquinol oxidase subunit IV [unclassified Rhizobium]MBO9102168.1 cytochrome o ubiquinol oxidase subunit IV [Rhizobium sp. L58/93]MBO9171901.1 cytochrome o ubiquinol oxidase subunit IV [Rhizobium sp. L245/93]MBO9186441.1 cytochrome o ubiquinol oxidase subunit IV [Rhizobium sp. E27B/91]QXZ87204.1 cytochrome o ubiquinol oxidase subunit IV [Rhizobium sp. K1/93]QXZ92763.1 cytochrome o ubiquinol oxidase subunit IV [Rhizobium sp. K15/93]
MADATGSQSNKGAKAPGEHGKGKAAIKSYVAGLILAFLLTVASFWAAQTDLVYAPAVPVLLAALAIGQMGVHLVFFLHISSGPEDTNNVLALAFGVFVVGLVVLGSMMIIHNLNVNMMPTAHLMDMG